MYVCFSHMACQEVCRPPVLAETFPLLAGRFVASVLTGLLDLWALSDENNLGW